MSFETELTERVPEKSTIQVTGVIRDEAGVAIPLANLTTLVLTLYNLLTGAIINSRNGQDIKNANGGTVDAGGNLTLVLGVLDTVVVDNSLAEEKHIALITWTYAAGAKTGRSKLVHYVSNLEKVT